MQARLQIEQGRGHCGREKDGDLGEEPHARECDRQRRCLGGESRQLGRGGVAVEAVPDADRDVRPSPRSGHVDDAGVLQVVPQSAHDGGGAVVEAQLDGVRHRARS